MWLGCALEVNIRTCISYFFVALIKHHDPKWLILTYSSRGRVCNGGRHDRRWARLLEQEAERARIYYHTWNRGQTETRARLSTIKAAPQWCTSSSKIPLSKSSTTSRNSVTNQRPSIQICEPIGNIFRSNTRPWTLFSSFCFPATLMSRSPWSFALTMYSALTWTQKPWAYWPCTAAARTAS